MSRLQLGLQLNYRTRKQATDVTGILYIDGAKFSAGYVVDLRALVRSARESGEFAVLIREGDVPQATPAEPILIWHKAGQVMWHVTEPRPARRLEFDEGAYVETVRTGLAQARRWVKRASAPVGAASKGIKAPDPAASVGTVGLVLEDLEDCIRFLGGQDL